LAKRGYEIARRTVTKYREQLHIPAAQMRAFLA
jgi:DNA-directed RNA polymerase specialized sigma54-like protein